MNILDHLSSRTGDRTSQSNHKVAAQCIENPALLAFIANALQSSDVLLVGDGTEVLTVVAESRPELIVTYIQQLIPLLSHRTTRVRWEAAHALSYVAPLAPREIQQLLPRLKEIISKDHSLIVKDYTIDILGNFAKLGQQEAKIVYPLLKMALSISEGRHAVHALHGFQNILAANPRYSRHIRPVAERFVRDKRVVVRTAAKSLLQATHPHGERAM